MARFEVLEGRPGMGKSLATASRVRDLLTRNKKWYEKGNPRRIIYSNIRWSDKFDKTIGEFGRYWKDMRELCGLRDCDIIWDEIANELDSRNWVNLSNEVKRFLSQYRKRGIDIYANTQDFSMVDARARLMVTKVARCKKLIGSRDPTPTKPPVRSPWGVILIREFENYREVIETGMRKYEKIPQVMLIRKELVEMYDTTQDIPIGIQAPYQHIERECELEGCKSLPPHKRIQHL